ncbi:MAG: hypothetical protein WC756_21495 [Taibaiella sp.]
MKNLKEEGAEGNMLSAHPMLAEKAFNRLGTVFNLASLSMKNAYDYSFISDIPEMVIYAQTVRGLSQTDWKAVSYAQEMASGGNNKDTYGMMGDMYKFFYYYRTHPKISGARFNNNILPYFKAHLSIDEKNEIQFDGNAIEFLHHARAKRDLISGIHDINSAKRAILIIEIFLKVQENLFDALLNKINNPLLTDKKSKAPSM